MRFIRSFGRDNFTRARKKSEALRALILGTHFRNHSQPHHMNIFAGNFCNNDKINDLSRTPRQEEGLAGK